MGRQRIPRHVPRNAPVVFLDEIDVLQIAYDALEDPTRETFGVFRGSRHVGKQRTVFRVQFIQTLHQGRRSFMDVVYSDRRFEELYRRKYNFQIIGDYHSHPGGPAHFSRDDLRHAIRVYPDVPVLLAVVAVYRRKSQEPNGQRERVIGRHTKILYIGGPYQVEMFFFVFRKHSKRLPRTRNVQKFLRRVYPVVRMRPDIHERPR